MSADSDNLRDTFTDQLEALEDHLRADSDSVEMLSEIQEGIGQLLNDNGDNEATIRQILQEQLDAGKMREETHQLVKSLLDRYVTEQLDTSPDGDYAATQIIDPPADADNEPVDEPFPFEIGADGNEDAFSATTVIGKDEPPKKISAEQRVQVGSVLRDRFLLEERVAGGSMGIVYKALDRRLAEAGSDEPYVAIKVLSPLLSRDAKALRALQQEAAKGRCLTHNHIVRFIDLDRDDDLYFIVMEWLDGQTLADILDTSAKRYIDIDRAVQITRQMGNALEYAHRCGIVHADVKPANVMIMPNGDAKLFDFGVARVRQKQDEQTDVFDPGVLGALTPAYSSMQVLTGEDPVPSDDVFSLACLFYRLVAGYRVFGPRNAAEAAEEGMQPQRPQGLSDTQWSAVKKALSYSRVTRFSSMKQFLEAFGEEEKVVEIIVDEPDRFASNPTREPSRLPWILLFGVVAAGAIAFYTGMLDPYIERTEVQQAPVQLEPFTADELSVPDLNDAAAEQAPDMTVSPGDDVAGQPDEAAVPVEVTEEPVIEAVTLPPADISVSLQADATVAETVSLKLRESDDPIEIDLLRSGNLDEAMTVRIEEVGFSGNRSPWVSDQYRFEPADDLVFAAGSNSVRLSISMTPDPVREPDQQSTLGIREVDGAGTAMAMIELTLEDDDQRSFELALPDNTVAFAIGQASVAERDPAVQIDVVRFNPDDTSLSVAYTVSDVTAEAGKDYFPPTNNVVTFGPGQRNTRILVPLVQDSEVEGVEAFVLELISKNELSEDDIFQRIAVMIRDDD